MNAKKLLISGLLLGILGILGVGLWAGKVYAESDDSGATIVDRLAERFNLNTKKVEDTFDEFRQERFQERQQQMQEKLEENLSEAVGDGVITEDQKQALLDKRQEMVTQRQQLREQWRTWSEESGIDFDQLREYGVGRFDGGFHGGGFGRGGIGGECPL